MLTVLSTLAPQPLRQRVNPDGRGAALTGADLTVFAPFVVNRIFWVSDVPPGCIRGGHAHRRCQQFVICLAGKVSFTLSDGASWRHVVLPAGAGLYIPPGIFLRYSCADRQTVLVTLCDRRYEADDYLWSLDDLAAWQQPRDGAEPSTPRADLTVGRHTA